LLLLALVTSHTLMENRNVLRWAHDAHATVMVERRALIGIVYAGSSPMPWGSLD
jgi:hypothetical protein